MAYGKILVDQVENSDGKSLNVGPSARVFDTVTDLQASTTLSDGDIVIVKERANAEYEIQSSSYTALDGDVTLTSGQVAELQLKAVNDVRWWGAVGDFEISDSDRSLDTGTDNLAYFESAIERLSQKDRPEGGFDVSAKVLSLAGLKYGVSDSFIIPSGNHGVTIKDGMILSLVGFVDDEDKAVVIVGDNSTPQPWQIDFYNVQVNARKRSSCILFYGTQKCSGNLLVATEFTTFGISSKDVNGELKLNNCSSYELSFADAAAINYEDRTGSAYLMRSADYELSNCVGACSKYEFEATAGYNAQVNNCHFWKGSALDGDYGDEASIYLHDNSWAVNFTNIYLDEGIVTIEDNFFHSFSNILAVQGNYGSTTKIFDLVATSADSTDQGLSINAVMSDRGLSGSEYITYSTSGSGSWIERKMARISQVNLGSGNQELIRPHTNIEVGTRGNIKQAYSSTGSRVNNTPALVCNQVPNAMFGSDDYNKNVSLVSFNAGTTTNNAFVGALAPSGVYGDMSSLPTTDMTLTRFWGTGSDGTDFGNSSNIYRGGGLVVKAHEDWASLSYGTRVEIYGTDSGDADPSRYLWMTQGGTYPGADDTYNLGAASYRWSQVYATNSTISTSDARLKTDLIELTDDEVNAAVAISKAMGYTWQWLKNGDRTHTGPTVQLIMGIMENNNLTPFDYSFICYDEWDEQTEKVEVTPAVLDDDGNVVTEAIYEEQVVVEAGDRYSFRENELIKFCNAGLSVRLDSQQETIDSILSRLDSLEG